MIPYGRTQIITGICPSKSNMNKVTKYGRFYKSTVVKDYERSFWGQCDVYRNKGINDLFGIEINVYFKNRIADLDGVFKVVLDSLQGCGAIMNDNLCYSIKAEKFIDKVNPRIEFKINKYETTPSHL